MTEDLQFSPPAANPPTQAPPPAAPRWDRWDAMAILGLAIAVAAATTIVLETVSVPGAFEDDGIYVVTAKALAEGRGYRRLDLPGEPLQTKYPPLYPFVLSLIWRVLPEFPRNLPAMQIFNALCGLAAGFAAFRLFRFCGRLPPWLPLMGATAAVVSPFWVQLAQ